MKNKEIDEIVLAIINSQENDKDLLCRLRDEIDKKYPRIEDKIANEYHDIKKQLTSIVGRVNLSINLFFDDRKPTVDYSFIKDEVTRTKANAYYHEMLRYEHGTRIHKQCFGEFCRLAEIQIEFLLNYFYQIKGLELFFNQVDAYNDEKIQAEKEQLKMPSKTDIKSIEDVKTWVKYHVFSRNYLQEEHKNENGDSYTTPVKIDGYKNDDLFNNINKMRNRKSHGGECNIEPEENYYLTIEEIEYIKNFHDKLKEINQKHKIDIIINDNGSYINKTKSNIPKDFWGIYIPYKNLLWMLNRDFTSVHKLLNLITSTCAEILSKH